MTKYKVTISGMHCASCASNIERSVKKIKGVKEANVSLMLKKGNIEAESKIEAEEIKKAVKRAGGYEAVRIEEE